MAGELGVERAGDGIFTVVDVIRRAEWTIEEDFLAAVGARRKSNAARADRKRRKKQQSVAAPRIWGSLSHGRAVTKASEGYSGQHPGDRTAGKLVGRRLDGMRQLVRTRGGNVFKR